MDSDTRKFDQPDAAHVKDTLMAETPRGSVATLPPPAPRAIAPPVSFAPPVPPAAWEPPAAPTAPPPAPMPMAPPVPFAPPVPPATTVPLAETTIPRSPGNGTDRGPTVAMPPTNSTYPAPTSTPTPVATPLFGRNSNIIPIVLMVLGALLFFTPIDFDAFFGSAIVLVIGLVFLYAYSQGRHFGFLVPGAIMTGLGLGIVTEAMTGGSGWVPLGLGLGFCAIWAMYRAHWWALIPGGIIALAGLQDMISSAGWVRELWHGWSYNGSGWWPLFLVLAGIWLIASRGRMTRRN